MSSPRPSRPSPPTAAFALLLALCASARAEENRFNVHLSVGPLFNLRQPEPADRPQDRVTLGGLHVRAAFEYTISEWVGVEVGWSPNILFPKFSGGPIGHQQIVVGARARPWWSRVGGYVLQRPRDFKSTAAAMFSDAWVDAHVGVVIGDGTRMMYDIGLGTRVPLYAPLQVGIFVRFAQLFGVGGTADDPTFLQLMAGVTFSLGFKPLHPEPDTDGDGVPDSRDKCGKTEPGREVGGNGCAIVKSKEPPPRCSDLDFDGICDGGDLCPDTPLNTPVEKNGCPPGQTPAE